MVRTRSFQDGEKPLLLRALVSQLAPSNAACENSASPSRIAPVTSSTAQPRLVARLPEGQLAASCFLAAVSTALSSATTSYPATAFAATQITRPRSFQLGENAALLRALMSQLVPSKLGAKCSASPSRMALVASSTPQPAPSDRLPAGHAGASCLTLLVDTAVSAATTW